MTNDIYKDFFEVAKAILMMIIGGGITWRVQHWQPRQVREDEHDKNQNATIEIQGRTLADAWRRIEEQEQKITTLQGDMRHLIIKHNALWNWVIRFVEIFYENGLEIPTVPAELQTDPEVERLLKLKKVQIEKKRKKEEP